MSESLLWLDPPTCGTPPSYVGFTPNKLQRPAFPLRFGRARTLTSKIGFDWGEVSTQMGKSATCGECTPIGYNDSFCLDKCVSGLSPPTKGGIERTIPGP